MPLEGHHIGYYHLLRQLSESDGYEAYRAEDTHSSAEAGAKEVIIELVKLTDTGHRDAKGKQKIHSDRIKRRIEALRALNHHHIVPIHVAEEAQIENTRYLYIATPYYKEGSLEDWWRARSKKGPLARQD